MKNLLSENMLRFGTKNLSEVAKKELTLKSIMETINEHGLHNAVKRKLNEAVSGQPDASLKLVGSGVTVPARTVCSSGDDYVQVSFDVQNTSLVEAYIYNVSIQADGFKGGTKMDKEYARFVNIQYQNAPDYTNFNVTDANGKKVIGQAEQKNYPAVKKGTTAKINAVIVFDAKSVNRYTEGFSMLKNCEITVEYNGIDLKVPVTFAGIRIDQTGQVPCDAQITLAKGF